MTDKIKAVIPLEKMPECCHKCILFNNSGSIHCCRTEPKKKFTSNTHPFLGRQSWCPIIEVEEYTITEKEVEPPPILHVDMFEERKFYNLAPDGIVTPIEDPNTSWRYENVYLISM